LKEKKEISEKRKENMMRKSEKRMKGIV